MTEMQPFVRKTTIIWIRSQKDVQLLAPYVMGLGYKWRNGSGFLDFQPGVKNYALFFYGEKKVITFDVMSIERFRHTLTVDDLPMLTYRNV